MSAALPDDTDLTRAQIIRLVTMATALNVISRGCLDAFAVFLLPLQQEFQSDRASVAAVYSFGLFALGSLSTVAGYLFDRFGPLRLNIVAFVIMVLSLAAASQATQLWHLYICFGLGIGLASASMGNAPQSALLARWFEGRRLSAVMSLIFAGNGLGTLIIVPMAQYGIELRGWRDTYLLLALMAAAGSLLLLLVPWGKVERGRPRPLPPADSNPASEMRAPAVDWTLPKALRLPAFWGLASVFCFTSCGMYSVMVQAVAYLIELGLSPLRAASIYGVIGILTPIGIVAFSWADGRIGRHASAALSYVLSLTGLFALWLLRFGVQEWLIVVFLLGVGLSFGARGPMIAATAARIFRGPRFGSIYGAMMIGSGIGTFSGTFIGALLHDISGGYTVVFIFSGISVLLGATPFWTYRALREAAS